MVVLGALCAVLPDADVVAFRFGVPYEHPLGHRGISHALVTAAPVAGVLAWALARRVADVRPARLWLALAVAIGSHGVLDALTNGGLGVALLAPLTMERYFLPWQPILVSPIGVRRFFTAYGTAVLLNEALWVGLPSLALWLWARSRPLTSRTRAG